jgi:outer membrane protein assembly factor BamB/4-amino-4-deoxy-L-arabinose transferase-like glycosyltransferase
MKPGWYTASLLLITLLSLIVRAVGVGSYPGLIYDEYYYVPAAEVLLRRRPIIPVKNMIPGIDPNLLSHPPLVKELIALAILAFGQHAWAWRLPGVLAGTALPLMIAAIAWELLQQRIIAIAAAALAALDGLAIVMSRVALPDAPAVTLVVAGLWILLTITNRLARGEAVPWWRWVGLGIVLGLGLACEWIGGQAILLTWIWFLCASPQARRAFRQWIPSTTIVPFVIYYSSYFYSWSSGFQESWLPKNPFWAFFKLQWLMLKGMWTLRFFHPWTANAWTWLGIPRPTAMLISIGSTQAIRLMAFSDPVIVWSGVLSLMVGLWLVLRQHRRWLVPWGFLSLWFLCFYATWLTTPRSKFLYYFTTASLGLDIAAVAGFVAAWQGASNLPRLRRWVRGALEGWGSVTLLTVAYCLPLWVGMAVPPHFYQSVFWPKSWDPRVRSDSTPSTQSFALTLNPQMTLGRAWPTNLLSGSRLAPAPSPWTVFRGTATHNSAYQASFTLHRSYRLRLADAPLVEAPSVAGHTAYVGTNDNQLYAINISTGAINWAVGLPNMVMTTPLVDNGLVVVGLGNNTFRDFSPQRGWVRGTGTNGLMAFRQKTGHEAWFYPTTGEVMPTPVVKAGIVYDVTGGSRLIAVDLHTGRLLWSLRLDGFDSMSSPIIVGNHLYVATNSYFSAYPATRSMVWSINVISHDVSWALDLPVKSGLSDCSVATNGSMLFIAGVPDISHDGRGRTISQRLFAIGRQDGHVQWSLSLGRGVIPSLDQEEEGIPLATSSYVYIGSPVSDRVVKVASQTGVVAWSRHLPTGVTANPVVIGSSLLVSGMSGRIYQLSARTGQIISQDPWNVGSIGPAAPLVVSNALLQSTLNGNLLVQQLSPLGFPDK